MKKILIAVALGLSLAACVKVAHAQRVCTEVTRPDGTVAQACRIDVDNDKFPNRPAAQPSTEQPTAAQTKPAAVAPSIQTAEPVLSAPVTQTNGDTVSISEKNVSVQFAPPATTSTPQATSMCSQTKSTAVSLLVISWSNSDQYTSKFCGYMHLYHEYVKIGAYKQAVDMLDKAEASLK